MTVPSEQELHGKVEQACRTAEEFTKIYYDSMDKKRHLLSRYYLDTGILLWNGNASVGKDAIQKFILALPTSDHTVCSLDAQPVPDAAVPGQTTVLVHSAGSVRLQARAPVPFQQSFLITAQGDKWKIVSDSFRHQVPVDLKNIT